MKFKITCPRCSGSGENPWNIEFACYHCNGEGLVETVMKLTTCHYCDGSGEAEEGGPCCICDGKGILNE